MRWLPFLTVTLLAPLAWAGPSSREGKLAILEDKLQIDEPTAGRVQSIVDKYKAKMAPLRRADAAIVEQLNMQLVISKPDDQRMSSLGKELIKNRQKLQEMREDRLHEMQKTLSPSQFARLLVSWPQLARALHHRVRSAPRG